MVVCKKYNEYLNMIIIAPIYRNNYSLSEKGRKTEWPKTAFVKMGSASFATRFL